MISYIVKISKFISLTSTIFFLLTSLLYSSSPQLINDLLKTNKHKIFVDKLFDMFVIYCLIYCLYTF